MTQDEEPVGREAETVLDAAGTRFTAEELRGRVTLVEPRIVVMREMTKPTTATLKVMTQRVEELLQGLEAFGMIIDLSDNQGYTTSEYRRFIPAYFADFTARSKGALKMIAVVFVGNPVLRVAANFIVARVSEAPFSLYKTHEDALAAVRAAIHS